VPADCESEYHARVHDSGAGFTGPIRTAIADVYAEDDGTVVLRFRPESLATVESVPEVVRAHVAAARGAKRPALADVSGLKFADLEARKLAAGPEVAAVCSHMALLVGNPVSRILGNFFLRVSRPLYPTRIFTDEASARRWLAEETSV
jgi:hypothetical protein